MDLLEALRPILGDECMHYRQSVYNWMAGNTPDFSKTLHNFYRKFPHFRTYVNEEFYFGDTDVSISDRIQKQLADLLLEKGKQVYSTCDQSGGKLLTYTHYKVYYAYARKELIPEISGGTIIC